MQTCRLHSHTNHIVVWILQSHTSCSRADHAGAYAIQSCISRNRADCIAVRIMQSRKSSGRAVRAHSPARPLVCAFARPLTHMLPVSLKMLLPPSPSPRLLSSLDELEPSLSDPLLDPLLGPDPEPFELPGIMRP